MSNRLFQGVIHQMRDSIDRTIGVIDDEGIRHLTLREGLRLFGYPETYDLDFFYNEKDGVNNGYDLLGNSVCVPVIKMIADRLVQKLYIK